jgi:hypothetical protein
VDITMIPRNGNVYLSDTNHRRIVKITPQPEVTTLTADSRLIWSDAMWIDAQGYLWIPATQQNLTKGFHNGQTTVKFPVWIYALQIGQMPSPIDHPQMLGKPGSAPGPALLEARVDAEERPSMPHQLKV